MQRIYREVGALEERKDSVNFHGSGTACSISLSKKAKYLLDLFPHPAVYQQLSLNYLLAQVNKGLQSSFLTSL